MVFVMILFSDSLSFIVSDEQYISRLNSILAKVIQDHHDEFIAEFRQHLEPVQESEYGKFTNFWTLFLLYLLPVDCIDIDEEMLKLYSQKLDINLDKLALELQAPSSDYW